MSTTDPILAEIHEELVALRNEVTFLRRQIGEEVRTRKVVVVAGNGREAITLEATDDSACVTVRSATHDDVIACLSVDEASVPCFAGVDVYTTDEGSDGAALFGVNYDHQTGRVVVERPVTS